MLVTVAEYDYRFFMDLSLGDDRIPNITSGLVEAEGIVLDYITDPDPDWTAMTVPTPIRSSILIVANALLDGGERGDMILAGLAENDPKNPVVGMLKRFRTPTLA